MHPFTAPGFAVSAFHCPHCNAYSTQNWFDVWIQGAGWTQVSGANVCICTHCNKRSLWNNELMVYPSTSPAPLPNPDLPDDIKTDYEEARSVMARSPRSACALLRLCVQKLCKELGEIGENINADIASLVRKGLSPTIQMSLDIVRVIGNEAVHPGQVDLRDDPDTAAQLCRLLNLIADAMISQPKAVRSLYASLPETKREQIEKRDRPKGS